jgi:hypothetical protein
MASYLDGKWLTPGLMINQLSGLKISCPLLDLPHVQADELLGKPPAQGAEVGL